ncbi:ADI_G0044570.mRNA.1.CDS.1 [Saccharomyces cerevisiae]|nr:Ecm7p [Saccharomyces cerevisiae YJM993]AJV47825.1 Ecm7p [Saccharomyces cerevisiae YJM1190]AJV54098.1 Ecm7p [Saccharomyces cerevisiae YJM1332]AJV54552.1 Ecm7p [Saccharomyces cerevisiae YJM1336]AJV56793.1 Ecm7p [Saccharomyces cerevisiae YJM1356]AJV62638.1 Ecm7p [Saccharomyces cerevisiae YJM1417]AJV63962.1 Ecm7p [Saccharomyces cerevisiae YJM1433]AJV66603.1 Ecm7p [Saccharomyces cerevisiae YJM1450]AJV72438.1 Ecm7p [Saccharomyces cerevisiae YJM189]AJV80377.1 Ecm7p [Saccharomyces cerevisiae YJ
MVMSRIRDTIARPFQNLTALEKVVQWLRLGTTLLIISFGLALTVGPLSSPRTLYMSRLDTYSADITTGLFTVLRESMEQSTSTEENNGVGLTTSELYILTAYTESQIKNVPQYITVSLYGRCDSTYTMVEVFDSEGNMHSVKNSTTKSTCSSIGTDYLFDYREVLESLGLDIILDYAYNKIGSQQAESSAYTTYMRSLKHKKANVLHFLYAVISFQVCMLFFMIWYYYIKGRFMNALKERALVHINSLLSLVVFIGGLISSISLAWVNYTIQSRINTELEAFGFSYHLGVTWFALLWCFAGLISVSCLAWSGLEWCISDNGTSYGGGIDDKFLGYQAGVFTDADLDDETSYSQRYPQRQSTSGEAELMRNSDTMATIRKTSDVDLNSENDAKTSLDHGNHTANISNGGKHEPFATREEFELQDIRFRSSNDSEESMQRVIKPSSALQF